MKEIDFLPEWYKSSRRRQFSYRTQYIALGGILLVMVVWHLLGLHSVSKAKALIDKNVPELKQAENTSTKLAELQGKISLLHKKQAVIHKTDSKINLKNILAEMSCLIDNRIVLSKVEITAEKFEQQGNNNSTQVLAAVRAASLEAVSREQMMAGNVRFKIVIAGVAADAVDVASLIQKLEESPYFSGIVLCFSRNEKIQTQSTNSSAAQTASDSSDISRNVEQKAASIGVSMSRFEISCYLANYREI